MITLDTVIQQLHIWDGQILLFIQEHLRGFPLRDELPAEELCGTGPSL